MDVEPEQDPLLDPFGLVVDDAQEALREGYSGAGEAHHREANVESVDRDLISSGSALLTFFAESAVASSATTHPGAAPSLPYGSQYPPLGPAHGTDRACGEAMAGGAEELPRVARLPDHIPAAFPAPAPSLGGHLWNVEQQHLAERNRLMEEITYKVSRISFRVSGLRVLGLRV